MPISWKPTSIHVMSPESWVSSVRTVASSFFVAFSQSRASSDRIASASRSDSRSIDRFNGCRPGKQSAEFTSQTAAPTVSPRRSRG